MQARKGTTALAISLSRGKEKESKHVSTRVSFRLDRCSSPRGKKRRHNVRYRCRWLGRCDAGCLWKFSFGYFYLISEKGNRVIR